MEKSILVLGGGGTGKTNYGAQLLLRLEAGEGGCKVYEPPTNITPLEDARTRLNNGLAASHTVGTQTTKMVLPIEFNGGRRVRLEWPDYAGERLSELVKLRQGASDWTKDLRSADAWLLFIRHDQMQQGNDILNRPIQDALLRKNFASSSEVVPWSAQAQLVELLQMLLFLGGYERQKHLSKPSLGIALSCYDTLVERERLPDPDTAFKSIAPLVSGFIRSNWNERSRTVFGLSALGKSLSDESRDEDFIDRGPHTQGWVIKPDGEKTQDLTWPLQRLINDTL